MNPAINAIERDSKGLLFISESEHPFEVIHFAAPPNSLLDHLKKMAGTTSDTIETQTLDYFFRNAIRQGETGEEEATAVRFRQLQQTLTTQLKNIVVYRIGTVQVHAFIIGEVADGSYAGLHTLLIET